jgi:hypothetical protein
MSLKPEQEDTVKKWAIEKFGEDSVKQLDLLFFEFHDIRAGCKDNFDFLYKVRDKHGEQGEQVVAALLYGMKMGELGMMMHLKEQEQEAVAKLPLFGHAT